MNIEVNDKGIIELRKVFIGIALITSDGERLSIAMRDSGFEITYEDSWYELKEGKVNKMGDDSIILKKDTANELMLLINNLIAGRKPHYKKQKQALKSLESKLV